MHTIDPDWLPETEGTLERFLLNPHGELDGMLLREGIEVHFPPHMGGDVEALARPGDVVRVRGVRPRGADVLAAVRVENTRGESVTDPGPPKDGEKHERAKARDAARERRTSCSVQGTIARVLHGPKGEAQGLVLDDGTILRWSPHESERIAELLRPGGPVAARGHGLTTKFGTVVEVRAMGLPSSEMQELEPKPKGGKHERKPHDPHPPSPERG